MSDPCGVEFLAWCGVQNCEPTRITRQNIPAYIISSTAVAYLVFPSWNAQDTVFRLERLFERFKLLLFLTSCGRSRKPSAGCGTGIGRVGSGIVKEGSLGGTTSMGGI